MLLALCAPGEVASAAPGLSTGSPGASSSSSGGSSSRGTGPSSPQVSDAGQAPVQLVSQTSWVSPGKTFQAVVRPTQTLNSGDVVSVSLLSQLFTRTAFDQVAAGDITGEASMAVGSLKVHQLPSDSSGDLVLRMPVEASAAAGDIGSLPLGSTSAIYPLAVTVTSPNGEVGRPLVTFVVFQSNGSTTYPRLRVALSVPFSAAPAIGPNFQPGKLSSSVLNHLASLASALAGFPTERLSLQINAETAVALKRTSKAGAQVDDALGQLVHAGDQLLPGTYVNTSIGGLVDAGLGNLADVEMSGARSALSSALGVPAFSTSTWSIPSSVDALTVQKLRSWGMTQALINGSDLQAVASTLTPALPSQLEESPAQTGLSTRVPVARVMPTDSILQARVSQQGGPVLAAEQTVAELAMIQLESPSVPRGASLVLPAGVSPAYLKTLLQALKQNPFAETVTASELFSSLKQDEQPPRTLKVTAPADVAGGSELTRALSDLPSLQATFPGCRDLFGTATWQVLVAVGSQVSAGVRLGLLAQVASSLARGNNLIRLPGSGSVTLTSLKANIPLTIIATTRSTAHVVLVVQSPKLAFPLYHAGKDGYCSVPLQNEEVCHLQVSYPQLLIKLPVETRTSGVFAMQVQVYTADYRPTKHLLLAGQRVTVRSTAVSFVGIVIIVLALLALAAWWIRDLRKGRRAKELVDIPPLEDQEQDFPEEGPEDEGPDDDGGGGGGPPDDRSGPGSPRPDSARPPRRHSRQHTRHVRVGSSHES